MTNLQNSSNQLKPMQSSIIAKILTLLTIISQSRRPMTFTELVHASGMNKSTIHRLLSICLTENLVQQDGQRKVYMLGPKVFDLVRDADDRFDLQALALDEMLRLYSLFGGNVTLGVPSGLEVVYLRMLEAKPVASPAPKPGMREPIHCSASGKALTAFLPDKIIDAKLAGYEFERFTERTITDATTFKAALEHVRNAGFARNDREEYDYFSGISAPIFDYQGNPVAVLNIWCLESQHPLSEMITWADELMVSANRVTDLIGGAPPALEKLRAG